jgi:hypothetical protein
MKPAALLLALACVAGLAWRADQPAIRFLHPQSRTVLVGPRGVTIPVQVWIERDAAHRQLEIAWDGEGCSGKWSRALDGDAESRIQPQYAPLRVHVHAGACTFVARTFDGAGRVKLRAEFTLRACGGEGDC